MERKYPRPRFPEGIFTRQERTALLFLAGVFLLGMGILSWRRAVPWMDPAIAGGSDARRRSAQAIAKPLQLQVRVNQAAAPELAALPGIGPVLARRIVADRQAHGCYLTLADLKRVKGVSRKTLGQIQGFVRFD